MSIEMAVRHLCSDFLLLVVGACIQSYHSNTIGTSQNIINDNMIVLLLSELRNYWSSLGIKISYWPMMMMIM